MTELLSELESGLERAFPELEIAPAGELDIGFGSVVLQTAGGLVFRVARHEGSGVSDATEGRTSILAD